MKITPRSFPYPVLSRFSDDVQPNTFVVNLAVTPSKEWFYLTLDVLLGHEGMAAMIASGDASLVIHVECQSNFYREAFVFNELAGTADVATSNLVGHVDVTFLVVAARNIGSYRLEGFHADYGDLTFGVGKSDCLALLETKYFIADRDPNVLRSVSAIIQVAQHDDGSDWKIDLEGNKILVLVPRNDLEQYNAMRKYTPISATLRSTIVIPALMEGLQRIRGASDTDLPVEREKGWFRVLEAKLRDLHIDIKTSAKSVFEIAQQIMEHPAKRTLVELDRMTGTGGDS